VSADCVQVTRLSTDEPRWWWWWWWSWLLWVSWNGLVRSDCCRMPWRYSSWHWSIMTVFKDMSSVPWWMTIYRAKQNPTFQKMQNYTVLNYAHYQ